MNDQFFLCLENNYCLFSITTVKLRVCCCVTIFGVEYFFYFLELHKYFYNLRIKI